MSEEENANPEERNVTPPEGGRTPPGSDISEDAQAAMFGELTDDENDDEDLTPEQDLDVILEIPVKLSVEIGHTQISIRKLLSLGQGSVVELDRLAGEPLDIKVNGMLIAHGEVVVVSDKFGIRLTDIISTSERIQKLK